MKKQRIQITNKKLLMNMVIAAQTCCPQSSKIHLVRGNQSEETRPKGGGANSQTEDDLSSEALL